MSHGNYLRWKVLSCAAIPGALWLMAPGNAEQESAEPDRGYWLLIQRVAGKELDSAEKELRRLLESRESELEKALAYSALLGAYQKARNAAVYRVNSEPSAKQLTKRAYAIIPEALSELHKPKAVMLVSSAALAILRSPRNSQRADETLSAEAASRLAKTVCDAGAAASRSLGELLQLSVLAQDYARFGYADEAAELCEEIRRLPSTSLVRGQCLLKVAWAWARLPTPDWERSLVTLDEALACPDLPAPDTLWAREEDVDRYRAEWIQKARQAPPGSRVTGYLTLWRHGLTERMASYWSDALHDQLKAAAEELGGEARRPAKVGDVAVIESESGGGKRTVTAHLEFPPKSPNPNGKWVFNLVSAKAEVPWPITWLIDRSEPPTTDP